VAQATAQTSGTSNADKVLAVVNEAGAEGITVKDASLKASCTVEQVRRAAKTLEAEHKISKDGQTLKPVVVEGKRRAEAAARDEKVLGVIQGAGDEGISKADIATQLDITERLTYESLWRLREKGSVTRTGATRLARWKVTG
jgi:predicted Rossmann fold nucleotide-binding protein DprA/Smf involved in DNA uptake